MLAADRREIVTICLITQQAFGVVFGAINTLRVLTAIQNSILDTRTETRIESGNTLVGDQVSISLTSCALGIVKAALFTVLVKTGLDSAVRNADTVTSLVVHGDVDTLLNVFAQ